MRIEFINVRNFRKLKSVKIDFSVDKTLFVGANNSGKTSAMDALRKFLVKDSGFIYNDLTVTNRHSINEIGKRWIAGDADEPIDLSEWADIVPIMDVWLNVEQGEFHYVANIIPTLDWTGGFLGVRLCYLPKNAEKLFDDYHKEYFQSRETENSPQNAGNSDKVTLYPRNLCEFIEKHLPKYFEVRAFILDPSLKDGEQSTDFSWECDEKNPFAGIIKIDAIYAQRGLADADDTNDTISLSEQLRAYYDKHLDIEKQTTPEDLQTLSALDKANKTFDITLANKFKASFSELEMLGFPGITDPKITIETKLLEKSAFEHKSAVQYALTDDDMALRLPEKFNGLGYQNLISIAFKLMSFRDDRIHKGKARSEENADKVAPLHLVLLEEPEAHLHVQVQQVLIKKAYEILTDNDVLRNNNFSTQLVVSTHSSHIAKEVEFNNIRYFKRDTASENLPISTATVVNLTDTFGMDEQTEKFVQRYLRVTHCDLFFADAVIFVEGTSETVLVPYFISNSYHELDSRYITVLPVGGSHSHKFKPLVDKLGVYTLVVTDLDSAELSGHHKGTAPKRKAGLITGNSSIKEWSGKDRNLDELLDLPSADKELSKGAVCIAYQTPVTIALNNKQGEALSATFEDSLVYANYREILNLTQSGIVKSDIVGKIIEALNNADVDAACDAVYAIIRNKSNDKVSFALDLIYWLGEVESPLYIAEGLEWLQTKLRRISNAETRGDGNE
jgi:predicted ATP-dependent endonuclease of OLD family